MPAPRLSAAASTGDVRHCTDTVAAFRHPGTAPMTDAAALTLARQGAMRHRAELMSTKAAETNSLVEKYGTEFLIPGYELVNVEFTYPGVFGPQLKNFSLRIDRNFIDFSHPKFEAAVDRGELPYPSEDELTAFLSFEMKRGGQQIIGNLHGMGYKLDLNDGHDMLKWLTLYRTPTYKAFFGKGKFFVVPGPWKDYFVETLQNAWIYAQSFAMAPIFVSAMVLSSARSSESWFFYGIGCLISSVIVIAYFGIGIYQVRHQLSSEKDILPRIVSYYFVTQPLMFVPPDIKRMFIATKNLLSGNSYSLPNDPYAIRGLFAIKSAGAYSCAMIPVDIFTSYFGYTWSGIWINVLYTHIVTVGVILAVIATFVAIGYAIRLCAFLTSLKVRYYQPVQKIGRFVKKAPRVIWEKFEAFRNRDDDDEEEVIFAICDK